MNDGVDDGMDGVVGGVVYDGMDNGVDGVVSGIVDRDALFGRQYYWEQHIGPFFTENPNSIVAIAIGIYFDFTFGFVLLLLFKISRLLGCIQFIIGIVLLLYITKPSLQMNQIRIWYQEILIVST